MPSQPVVHSKPSCETLSPITLAGRAMVLIGFISAHSQLTAAMAAQMPWCARDAISTQVSLITYSELKPSVLAGRSLRCHALLCELCRTSTGWRLVRAAYSLINVFTDGLAVHHTPFTTAAPYPQNFPAQRPA